MIYLNYGAILFDFDGTITESGLGITRSAAYACEKMGLPVPGEDTLRKFVGPPLVPAFRKYLGLSEADALKAVGHYRERYNAAGWKENSVYPGHHAAAEGAEAARRLSGSGQRQAADLH